MACLVFKISKLYKSPKKQKTMEFYKEKILSEKELSKLDEFAFSFIELLKKHTDYVVVSGYISILLGRARVSEDIDIIIPKMSYPDFQKLLSDLKTRFYCLNAEKDEDIYDYVTSKVAVRFAKKDTVIPNVELRFTKNKYDRIALNNSILYQVNDHKIKISQLELHIAFKEKVLKSPKDIEDAKHVREVAKEHLDLNLITRYKDML